MSEYTTREVFIELKEVISNIHTPLVQTIQVSMDERLKRVNNILSELDPFATFFSLLPSSDNARLGGLHICHGIARNIGVAAEENGILGYDYNEAFIGTILNRYIEELNAILLERI